MVPGRHLFGLVVVVFLSGLACREATLDAAPAPSPGAQETSESGTAPRALADPASGEGEGEDEGEAPARSTPPPAPVRQQDYAWLADMEGTPPATRTLESRFAPPAGFKRVEAAPGSFGAWLRGLPIREDRRKVLSYAGAPLGSPSAAVVLMDVGERDLQQCADTAIRLHAEYLWSAGRAEKIGYHFTSGDLSMWSAWQKGERFKLKGRGVERVRGKAVANTHASLRAYLDHTFRYAGTQSLWRDSTQVPSDKPLAAGDFFVQPGGPGHAVVLLDVVEHPDGRRAALVGQGYMPAQELHVVTRRGADVLDGVWFVLPGSDGLLDTPSWRPFSRDQARRFKL